MGEWADRLRAMNETWKGKKDAEDGVPTGTYILKVDEISLRLSSSEKLMLSCSYIVLEGEHQGTQVRTNIMLELDFGPPQASKLFRAFGFEPPEDAEGIEGVAAAITKQAPRFQAKVVRNDKGFTNVTVIKVLDSSAAPTPVSTPKPKPTPATTKRYKKGDAVSFVYKDKEYFGVVTGYGDDGLCHVEADFGGKKQLVKAPDDKLKSASAAAAPEVPPEDPEWKIRLLVFAGSKDGLKELVSDAMTVDELTDTIKKFEFKEDELTPEELETAKKAGATIVAKSEGVSL